MGTRGVGRGEATSAYAWATIALCFIIASCTSAPAPSDAGPCPDDRSVCNGVCVDPRSDPQHCGHCGLRCAPGEGCVRGQCVDCPLGFTDCDGDRTNGCEVAGESDPHNCGGCGHACPAGVACVGGTCACPRGLLACDGRCLDASSDTQNCGSCSHACPSGGTCTAGSCACVGGTCECPRGLLPCGGRCLDASSDTQNCGACGHACPSGGTCIAGSCVCVEGRVECGARCVDTQQDAQNCGACGHACPSGGTCIAGSCACLEGRVECGARCVDTQQDAQNCGACDRPCYPEQPCVEGRCVVTCRAGTPCDGVCVDLGTSVSNCGACGHRCGLSERCESGVCVGCPMGTTRCGGGCYDVTRDREHCGECDRRCAASEQCEDGLCTTCSGGRLWCRGDVDACGEDILTNRARCGACGTVCGGGPGYTVSCRAGRCAHACVAGAGECDGDDVHPCETSLSSDDAHCGACGAACSADAFCVGGRCVVRPIRPRAPTSALYVTRATPWLFWELPPGADGARVEVCATRACDRLDGRWDVTGSRWRVPTSLSPGVHFWRLFARRGGRTDTTPGPVWELVVPAAGASTPGATRALLDVNGDGLEDRVTPRNERDARGAPRWALDVFFGGSASTAPDQSLVGDEMVAWASGFDWSNQSATATDVVALGDINGDGYGDVLLRKRVSRSFQSGASTVFNSFDGHDVFVGGPSGLAAAPVDSARIGSVDYRYTVPPNVTAMFPTGDADGDGYGDWFWRERGTRAYWDTAMFGGRASIDGANDTHDWNESTPLVGDFDADGTADLAACEERAAFPFESLRPVAIVIPGGPARRASTVTAASISLGPCGGVARPDGYATVALAVLDADDDGYDDLRATIHREPAVTMLYRGGPDGLSESRCEVLP